MKQAERKGSEKLRGQRGNTVYKGQHSHQQVQGSGYKEPLREKKKHASLRVQRRRFFLKHDERNTWSSQGPQLAHGLRNHK